LKMFFRLQWGRYSLEEMQNHVSEDGGDGWAEAGGLCACDSVSSLMANTVWTTDPRFTPGAEVIIFRGRKLVNIYDGVRVYPTEIVARMTVEEFMSKVEDGSI